jgi:nitrate reductase gamma subunit
MNKNAIISLIAVVVLCVLPVIGAIAGLNILFGVVIPYLAITIFLLGFISKIISWSKSSVPFKIPTTCGQQESLPWIKANKIDNPFSKGGVIIRMMLEVLCFRSLFRNTSMSVEKTKQGNMLSYSWEIFLWVGALAFHYSFLVVVIRHMRFFLEPVPYCLKIVQMLDGLFKVEIMNDFIALGIPGVMMTGFILLAATSFLLARRFFSAKVNYISLAADYFPLFLILGIAITGILMKHFFKVDIISVKELTMSLVYIKPAIPENVDSIFYIHLFLVCTLLVYFPFSKLMHMGGIFLSPTRNQTADSRRTRHINPWNPEVKHHTYDEYEDEFREVMTNAGLSVDKKEK